MLTWFKNLFKKYFITGLLILGPISITALIIKAIIQFADTTLQTSRWLPVDIPGLGVLLALLLILLTGFAGRNLLGLYTFKYLNDLIKKIPVFGPLYGSIAQVFETLLSNKSRNFSRVVLIPYPHDNIWTLAFVTSEDAPAEIQKSHSEKLICVFVPTTPNPTSGFYLFVPAAKAKPTSLSVEQALKTVVSLGLASSGEASGN